MVGLGSKLIAFFAIFAPAVPHYYFLFYVAPKLRRYRQEIVFIVTCVTLLVLTGVVWLLKNQFGFGNVLPQSVVTLVFLAAVNINYSLKYPSDKKKL
jgi:hypothetical protein